MAIHIHTHIFFDSIMSIYRYNTDSNENRPFNAIYIAYH